MRKSFKTILLIITLILISIYPQGMLIINADENVERIAIVDKSIVYKDKYIDINVEIPQILGMDDEKFQNDINQRIVDFTNNWINEAKDASKQLEPRLPYVLNSKFTSFVNEDYISFYIDYYQFSGGAHGITMREAYNIRIKDSKEIKLKDLFEEGYDYKEHINKIIYKEIENNPGMYFIGELGFNGIDEDQSFYLKEGYIVVFFQQYEIAPYVAGLPEFLVEMPKKK